MTKKETIDDVRPFMLDQRGQVSMTKQSFKNECDINVILSMYEKNGVISHLSEREPMYADVTNIPDFRVAQDIVIRAETMFNALPANVRSKFDNDPAKLVDFVKDPANKVECQDLGLLPSEKPVEAPGGPPVVVSAPAGSQNPSGAPVVPPKAA